MQNIKDEVGAIFRFYAQHYEGLGPDICNKFELKFIDATLLIKELTEREAKLVDALKFYANEPNGKTARATLQSLGLQE